MKLERKVEALIQLGHFFDALGKQKNVEMKNELMNQLEIGKELIETVRHENSWFSPDAVKMAFNAWANALNKTDIHAWLKSYNLQTTKQKVGVIMAGNIPMVGLHDVLSVLVCEHELHAKLSSKDKSLMQFVLKTIGLIEEEWRKNIKVVDRLNEIDSLIATGSDNSARYFDFYFKNKKRIIRKNRTSVAILDGSESENQLKGLASDVFTYYGLGCRNVTKVFIPKGYDKDKLFGAFFNYKHYAEHNAYANNYDYNKAVYLLNNIDLIENGFLLLKEDKSLHSPVGVLFYEEYEEFEAVEKYLKENEQNIQCIVSEKEKHISFGEAQQPKLWDYADGVDTIAFLLHD